MAPFNDDYTSSIFASLDHVAISSVAHDFLRTEYNPTDWPEEAYPNYEGVDDYLQQAADTTYWPENFTYDPEGDGTALKSLGVHEHWNNPVDKQYTRDLGAGDGIELVKILHDPTGITTNSGTVHDFMLHQNYPNPFNPATTIAYQLKEKGHTQLTIYNALGEKIATLVNSQQTVGYKQIKWNAINFSSGVYFYRLSFKTDHGVQTLQKKMLLIK